jgi:hypothetical protein
MEKLAGADIVYTCPGKFIAMADELCRDIEFHSGAWKEGVPEEVLEKLNKFRYFREACDPFGLEPPQFDTHPSMVATATQFGDACTGMEEFVEQSVADANIISKVRVLA